MKNLILIAALFSLTLTSCTKEKEIQKTTNSSNTTVVFQNNKADFNSVLIPEGTQYQLSASANNKFKNATYTWTVNGKKIDQNSPQIFMIVASIKTDIQLEIKTGKSIYRSEKTLYSSSNKR